MDTSTELINAGDSPFSGQDESPGDSNEEMLSLRFPECEFSGTCTEARNAWEKGKQCGRA